jgi:WD40 repeat protein
MSGHRDFVTEVAGFADGKRVASGSWDGNVKIWKMIIKYVPTPRVYNLLLSALNEDVMEIIMKYAVANQVEKIHIFKFTISKK